MAYCSSQIMSTTTSLACLVLGPGVKNWYVAIVISRSEASLPYIGYVARQSSCIKSEYHALIASLHASMYSRVGHAYL